MKTTVAAIVLLLGASLFAASVAPDAFTYQGRLFNSGDPLDGTYTMTFKAYDSLTGGTQIGSTITATRVDVSNGYFQQQLDFGPDLPRGVRVWLEITVKKYHTIETAAVLSPRHELTPAPIAMYAQKAETLVSDAPMINQVVRLDISGKGTFYFSKIIDFNNYTEVVEYMNGEDRQLRKRPGRSHTGDFHLVRYAAADCTFWAWKDQIVNGSATFRADCNLYVIDTRTSIVKEAWHLTQAWPSRLELKPADQWISVFENVTMTSEAMQPLTTGQTMTWSRPPVQTIALPATLTIDSTQNESVESFTDLGWKFDVIEYQDSNMVMRKKPGTFKCLNPECIRATTGLSYIPLWYKDVLSGTVVHKSMTLTFYNSTPARLFGINMFQCWPVQIKKDFIGSRDNLYETLSFAIEDIVYAP